MPTNPITIDALHPFAIARSLFVPVSLAAAIQRLGFVQAGPIRVPTRGGAGFDLAASREALAIAILLFAAAKGAAGRIQFLDASGVRTSSNAS